MNKLLLSFTLMAACVTVASSSVPVYLDETRTIDERVEDALSRMTTEEKVAMLHARCPASMLKTVLPPKRDAAYASRYMSQSMTWSRLPDTSIIFYRTSIMK